MDIGVLIGVVACAVVIALKVDLSGSTVRTVGGMYHAPDLGWPHGVQEDDDMHWSWAAGTGNDAGGRPRIAEPEWAEPELAEPELEEVDSRSIRLELQPIRRRSH